LFFLEFQKQIHLVLEYAGKETLYSYIKSKPEQRLDIDEARRLFRQIMAGVAYCHNNYIVHRDLKLENILLINQKEIKLIDFGFSISADSEQFLTLFRGPPADIWACGIMLYKMLTGSYPFAGENDKALFKEICHGSFSLPEHFDHELCHLLQKILVLNPSERLGAIDILAHPWMRKK
jgi:MAP/microtubule affinity-regulating kinase